MLEKRSIIDQIAQNMLRKNFSLIGPGLLTGKSGMALFMFHYSRFANDETFSEIGREMFIDVFTSINQGYSYPTFCDGVSGYAWLADHLVQHRFILEEEVPFLDVLDDSLQKQMMKDIKKGEWDFLHESLGIATYFLSRLNKPWGKKIILNYIESLNEVSRVQNGLSCWTSVADDEEGATGCNLGMAHGVTSIISFLTKARKLLPQDNKKIDELIISSVNYLISQKVDPTDGGAYFPNVVFDNGNKTIGRRLGWCYGDIPRGLILYEAGTELANDDWKNLGLEVLLNSANLSNTDENVVDPGLCHGTSGIAYLFDVAYKMTNNIKLKEASEYWWRETLSNTRLNQGLEDFEKLYPGEENSQQEFGLLVGLSGIGLALMSNQSDFIINWDRSLLIS